MINDILYSLAQNMLTKRSWERVKDYIVNRDKYICQYCGEFDTDGAPDHILPLARGGTDAVHNLVWSCKSCNSSKGDNTVRKWIQRLAENERQKLLDTIKKFSKLVDEVEMRRVNFVPGLIDIDNLTNLHYGVLAECEAAFRANAILHKKWLKLGIPEELIFEFEYQFLYLTGAAQLFLDIEDGILNAKSIAQRARENGCFIIEYLIGEMESRRKQSFQLDDSIYKTNGNGNGHHQPGLF